MRGGRPGQLMRAAYEAASGACASFLASLAAAAEAQRLPTSHACFFLLALPRRRCAALGLFYAIETRIALETASRSTQATTPRTRRPRAQYRRAVAAPYVKSVSRCERHTRVAFYLSAEWRRVGRRPGACRGPRGPRERGTCPSRRRGSSTSVEASTGPCAGGHGLGGEGAAGPERVVAWPLAEPLSGAAGPARALDLSVVVVHRWQGPGARRLVRRRPDPRARGGGLGP